MRLDDIDRQIIASLVQDSRESYAAIGQKVGLSAPAVKRRVDVLQQTGAIKRFTAEVDPLVLGWHIQAFVELHCDGGLSPSMMRTMAAEIAEVTAAYTVTGEADGIFLIRAENTTHLEDVMVRIREWKGVNHTRSSVILSHL
ncbi:MULTISPECIES: Lrp/AsnC family transcriptional regulator [Kocuria]|uniref:Lrp/AsnC family transcriptional regulator n=1 Tax=Kocuria TaxID=57493 RepID=UPI000ADD345B|nr:Lrp/AsnC family transcriptional regulator [Kocuria polaris]